MTLLEERQEEERHILLSILVILGLIPTTLMLPFGGMLADICDRKSVIVTLDVLGACVALLYAATATQRRSIAFLFLCTVLQQSLAGLYEPSRSAILPQLLVHSYHVQKANTLAAMVWSITAALASSLGGWLVKSVGVAACFLADCGLYVLSAFLVYRYVATVMEKEKSNSKETHQTNSPWTELRDYYGSKPQDFPFVMFKGCGALVFGASDVLNVTFAKVDDELDSQRLGWMFAAVGVGCLVGPLLVPDKRSFLRSCVTAYYVLSVGFSLIGASHERFFIQCMAQVFRSAGTAVLWVDSSILIQASTPNEILGRVTAIDLCFATFGESFSVLGAGVLQDNGWPAESCAYLLAVLGLFFACLWTAWLVRRREHFSDDVDAIELEPLN